MKQQSREDVSRINGLLVADALAIASAWDNDMHIEATPNGKVEIVRTWGV